MNDYLGGWTDEIPNNWKIRRFISAGPKYYGYEIEKKEERRIVCKMKGITQSWIVKETISINEITTQVDTYVQKCGDEKGRRGRKRDAEKQEDASQQ